MSLANEQDEPRAEQQEQKINLEVGCGEAKQGSVLVQKGMCGWRLLVLLLRSEFPRSLHRLAALCSLLGSQAVQLRFLAPLF